MLTLLCIVEIVVRYNGISVTLPINPEMLQSKLFNSEIFQSKHVDPG